MYRNIILSCLAVALLFCGAAGAIEKPNNLPREDVVNTPAIADGLCVNNAFQSDMVIQRNKLINIWGWAKPGEKVEVSFAGQKASTTAKSDRSWKVTLNAAAGNSKPQTMTVSGKNKTLKIEDILVGDVWVLGGQSNMEFPIHKVNDGQLEIVSANFPQIRILTMPVGKGFDSVHSFERLFEWSNWSKRHFVKGYWEVCTPETVRELSAIGYVFARRLQMATKIPIGIIDTSQGGTTVEAWTPEDVLKKIKGTETQEMMKIWQEKIDSFDPQQDLKDRMERHKQWVKRMKDQGKPANRPAPTLRPGPVADKNRPGCRYASTIRPLEGLSVKGAVFHPGFNNCFNGSEGARMYYQVFGKMITAWRSVFNDDKLPFCIMSLCTAGEPQTMENFLLPMYDVGPLIREAQYKTFRDFYDAGDKNIGFASTFDFRKSWYHPQIKVPAGERAAKWALESQYEMLRGSENWLPPTIDEVKITDGTIQLKMSTNISTKDDSDGKMLGFAIAGKDRNFYPAKVEYYTDGVRDNRNRLRYKKNILVLSSPFVPEPVHFRHAWARNPMTNVTNGQGIPIATQRSDEWILEKTPVKVDDYEDKNSRQIRNELRRMLKNADIERRYKEAKLTAEELKPAVEKINKKK